MINKLTTASWHIGLWVWCIIILGSPHAVCINWGMATSCASGCDIAANVERLTAEGLQHLERARYRDAESSFTEALGLDPKNAEAYLKRGLAREQLEAMALALDDYNQCLSIAPENMECRVHRGIILCATGDVEGAINDLLVARTAFPQRALIPRYLSRAYALHRDSASAIHFLDEAIALSPGDAILHYERGLINTDCNNIAEAFQDFAQVERLEPQSCQPYVGRARAYFHSDDLKQAIEQDKLAIRINPNCADAYSYLGASELRMAARDSTKLEAAKVDLDLAVALDPKAPWGYLFRAALHHKLGNHDAAVADARQGAKYLPHTMSKYRKLADLYKLLGELETAIVYQKEAVRLALPGDRESQLRRLAELEDAKKGNK